MALDIIQITLISLFAFAALVYGVAMVGFRVWKRAITVPAAGGFGYHYKSTTHEKRYDKVAQLAERFLNPVVLLWVAGASLGVWIIIRVILSFTV